MDKTKWAYLRVQVVPVEFHARLLTNLIDTFVIKCLAARSRRQDIKRDPGHVEWHHFSWGMQNATWVASHSGCVGLDDEIVAEKAFAAVRRGFLDDNPLTPARIAKPLRESSPGNARTWWSSR
jgi:hypothetical protein